jgi:thioredoxin-like negative regulator of GroEL
MTRAKTSLMAVVLLMLAACGLFDSTERQLLSAQSELAAGNYGAATVILRNVLDGNPGRPGAQLLLARALYMQGDTAAAERVLSAVPDQGADAAAIADLRAQWKLGAGQPLVVLEATEDPEIPFAEERRRYYRARALQALRRIPEALVIYRELLASQPASADLQLRIAQCHAFHGRNALAEEALLESLSLGTPEGEAPVIAEAWLLKATLAQLANDSAAEGEALGKALAAAPGELPAPQHGQLLAVAVDRALRADDIAGAQRLREDLVRVLPQAPLTQIVGAQLKMFGDDPAGAVADLQRLLQKEPGNHTARALLVSGQLRVGAFEQALKEANALQASAPAAPDLAQLDEVLRAAVAQPAGAMQQALAVATAQVALRQPALARLTLRDALARHSGSIELTLALARVELRSGRHAEALRLTSELSKANPRHPDVMSAHAEALGANGKQQEAVAVYEALWQAAPAGPLAIVLADARRRAGSPAADQSLREWLEGHPRDASVRLNLAIALQQSGDLRGAAREFDRTAGDTPTSHPLRAIALNNLAWVYHELSDPRALEIARQAHEGASGAAFVQDTYGWLLARAGRLQEALPLLKAAADGAPTSATIRYHHAAALARAGESAAARLLLEDILQAPGSFDGRADAEQLLGTLR